MRFVSKVIWKPYRENIPKREYGVDLREEIRRSGVIFFEEMADTSSPAVFVNGELLKMHAGRRVRAVVQVMRIDGMSVTGKSTDGYQVTVKGCPSFPMSHFVEVIGIAESSQSLRGEICTDFGEKFDVDSYNKLCQLANGDFKNLFL